MSSRPLSGSIHAGRVAGTRYVSRLWSGRHIHSSDDVPEWSPSIRISLRFSGLKSPKGAQRSYYGAKVPKNVSLAPSVSLIASLLHRVALYEAMTRFVLPLCTYLPHSTSPTPISSVTTIIDLENVSLGTLWNWRKHLQEASTLATANYPETLNTIAVVNSPSFFPTVWGWVKVCLALLNLVR